MTPEAAVYAQELRWILAEHGTVLAALGPAHMNSRPTPAGNSPLAIAAHVVGCTRAWVLGMGCDLPVTRDRPAEFAAVGTRADDAVRELDVLSREIGTALGRLSHADLDRRLQPTRELWGTGEMREISSREAIVEAIRHAALHLGELRLTDDLLATPGARP